MIYINHQVLYVLCVIYIAIVMYYIYKHYEDDDEPTQVIVALGGISIVILVLFPVVKIIAWVIEHTTIY